MLNLKEQPCNAVGRIYVLSSVSDIRSPGYSCIIKHDIVFKKKNKKVLEIKTKRMERRYFMYKMF